MDTDANRGQRMGKIAEWLLKHKNTIRPETAQQKWGDIAEYTARECPKKVANLFLLCCLIDYQTKTGIAWGKGSQFIKKVPCPDEVWEKISNYTREEWESEANFKGCGLHWMHKAHNRLWQIAKNICFYYGGDARRIWQETNSFDALCRLAYIGAGSQISRMIVGALKDCGQLSGKCDVKADVYICRVLGRAISGKDASPTDAMDLARQLHPSDPWQLDWPLWNIGDLYCKSTDPKCSECVLAENCLYAHEHTH
jgi:endonuclease III